MILLIMLVLTLPTRGHAAGASEVELRAMFLYHFAGFVTWPETATRSATQPLRICIPDEIVAPLVERLVKGEQIDNKPIIVVHPVDSKRWGDCHIYYISASQTTKPAIQAFLRRATDSGILTVSDNENFTSIGGMISLVRTQGRIHPLINTDEVARGKIKISPKLLKLSTTIQSK